ncbi:Hypothetical_protein [Hexamita inflata]|uniref:Hypothetical_protein n=1 Tax=Hexamita inflata TaxID=28002 RepID=A0AA86PPH4_9EUKA|nr:Hypothetical protein HINF_LOCUS31414 [Hexamita inflata]
MQNPPLTRLQQHAEKYVMIRREELKLEKTKIEKERLSPFFTNRIKYQISKEQKAKVAPNQYEALTEIIYPKAVIDLDIKKSSADRVLSRDFDMKIKVSPQQYYKPASPTKIKPKLNDFTRICPEYLKNFGFQEQTNLATPTRYEVKSSIGIGQLHELYKLERFPSPKSSYSNFLGPGSHTLRKIGLFK